MGIDMLENSELGALSQSRLGNKCFVDEGFSNFSIVSKKEKRRRAETASANVSADWSIDPKYANDCEYLQLRLTQLQDAIEGELNKNPSKVVVQRTIAPMRDWEVKYKNAITLNKCTETQQAIASEKEKQQTLGILSSVGNNMPTNAQTQKTSATNKYLIYGVGGVVLLIGLAILFKK